MRNTTCTICFKEFEPREGKLYCSNACKQKGYTDKKHHTFESQKKENEVINEKKKIEIHFPEFQKFNSKYPDTIPTFILYCFFRKNLTGVTDIEEVYNYIKAFDSEWWQDFWSDEKSIAKRKYNEFEENYFDDNFIVSFGALENK